MSKEMNEFVKVVKRMRFHQKTYFSLKPGEAKREHLIQSKVAEKEVDQMIERFELGQSFLNI